MSGRYGGFAGRTLFLDLDGVLADFDGYFEAIYGTDPHTYCDTHGDDAMWALIHAHPYGFFASLPPCRGAHRFYAEAARWSPIVLTACPPSRYADVAAQKRAWIRNWLGDVPMLPTHGAKAKPFFMHATGDILIDDFAKNIERWRDFGGVGIHHTGDFSATLAALYAEIKCPTIPSAPGTSRAPSADRKTTSPGTTTATPTASRQAAAIASPAEEKPLTVAAEGSNPGRAAPWNCS